MEKKKPKHIKNKQSFKYNTTGPSKRKDENLLQEQLHCGTKELSRQALNNPQSHFNDIKSMGLFFSPRQFWGIYLCYLLMFFHGLLSISFLDPTIIRLQMGAGELNLNYNITITIFLVLLFLLLAIFKLINLLVLKSYKLCFITLFHVILFFICAENISSFGDLILWGVFRK